MQMKTALFIAPFLCIYCVPTNCMDRNVFSTDQVHIVQQRMQENPDSFNALSREIAHQLYQQNPNITRSQLVSIFRANGADRAAVLPLDIIQQIWQFIAGKKIECGYNYVQRFIRHFCGNNLREPCNCRTADSFGFRFPLENEAYNDVMVTNNESQIKPLARLNPAHIAEQAIELERDNAEGCLINVYLYYGKTSALFIIMNGKSIFVVPNIPYLHQVTTGEQLINNIYQSCSCCREFTSGDQARKWLGHLDISTY